MRPCPAIASDAEWLVRDIDNLAGIITGNRELWYAHRGLVGVAEEGPQRADYLLHFSMRNFYFHVITAYDILRHNGLEIGKADFIGDI